MSKKTEQIYKAISSLEDLQNQISIINQLAKAKGEESHHLENIEFEMRQHLKTLRFWIGSLYSYNGKSTSRAKQRASKENGKKGGRPPKEICGMKKRKAEIESLCEELYREKSLTIDFDKEENLGLRIAEYEKELAEIEGKLERWSEERLALKTKTSAFFAE